MTKYYPPEVKKKSFTCPICNVYSMQMWHGVILPYENPGETPRLEIASCVQCNKHSFWLDGKMIFPIRGNGPFPSEDMPAEIKKDYEEALLILSLSPRSAAALLRLAIQKLCKELGEEGNNINDDIASLVKKGLSAKIQQSLDFVRVIGNNAVHPGQIDIEESPEILITLFEMLNIIVETMIAQPRRVEDAYKSLPEAAIKAIKKRDN